MFNAPATITLSATASATQGYTVSKVEFFYGDTNLIGTDTSSPYSINWANVAAGSYTLTAKATAIKKNSPDQTATSAAVSITVNALPTASMTAPAAGAVFAAARHSYRLFLRYLIAIGLMGVPTACVTGSGGAQKKNS